MRGERSQMVFSEGGSAVVATVSTVLVLVLYCTALHCSKYYWYCTPTEFCSVTAEGG
jgi:hypothetical protein